MTGGEPGDGKVEAAEFAVGGPQHKPAVGGEGEGPGNQEPPPSSSR